MYRGKQCAQQKATFRIRCHSPFEEYSLPILGPQVLAVDVRAVACQYTENSLKTARMFGRSLQDESCGSLSTAVHRQIAACARNGVRKIVIVVGNDRDSSDVTFTDLPPSEELLSPSEKGAIFEAARMKNQLVKCWTDIPGISKLEIPEIKVMAVQRPAPTFKHFPRLPQELQDMVWRYAAVSIQVFPFVATRNARRSQGGIAYTLKQKFNASALLTLCSASRRHFSQDVFKK